jgi:uncharacterized membrane protein YoaK (UPF0700 family)
MIYVIAALAYGFAIWLGWSFGYLAGYRDAVTFVKRYPLPDERN